MKTFSILKGVGISILTVALWSPAPVPAQQQEAETKSPDTQAVPAPDKPSELPGKTAQMDSEAKKLLDQVQSAYNNLSAVEMSGEVSVNIDAASIQEKTNQTFTSSFQAPNRFRHEVKETLTVGSDGKQAYVFNESANSFARIDTPGERVPVQELPPVIPQILQTQNPSLLFALTTNSLQEVADSFGKVTKLEDEKIDGKAYPGLEFTSQENRGRMVMRIDPTTHLIRRFTIDFSSSLEESGAQDVKDATVTVDYANIQAKPTFARDHFAWAPPEGAMDLRESAGAQPGQETQENGLVGKMAPDFTLPALDGKKVSLSDMKGQVVVLDFWATWCPPCVKSLPMMAQVYQDNKNENVKVFAINLREDKQKVEGFLDERNIDIPVLLDEDGSIAEKYNVQAIPQTVVIGADGRVQKVFTGAGPNTEQELRTTIQSAKKETD